MTSINLGLRTPVLAILFLCGCGDVEWNWDNTFWQRQGRVIKPAQGSSEPHTDSRPSNSQAGSANASDSSGSARAERRPANVRESNERPDAETPSDSRPAERSAIARPSTAGVNRSFYNLYLVPTNIETTEAPRNQFRVRLGYANPQNCARLLEDLYVPLGRSGSSDETYLIYEQRDEFDKALNFAPLLDVPAAPPASAPAAAGWNQAVGTYYSILDSGAVVDADLIAAAERGFAAIAQGTELSSQQRWAAGVFAGRIAAGYRYDFEAARGHYATARSQISPDSVEEMTNYFWRADTYVQEGKIREATDAYEEILDAYTHLWPRSPVIARSYELSKKYRKK